MELWSEWDLLPIDDLCSALRSVSCRCCGIGSRSSAEAGTRDGSWSGCRTLSRLEQREGESSRPAAAAGHLRGRIDPRRRIPDEAGGSLWPAGRWRPQVNFSHCVAGSERRRPHREVTHQIEADLNRNFIWIPPTRPDQGLVRDFRIKEPRMFGFNEFNRRFCCRNIPFYPLPVLFTTGQAIRNFSNNEKVLNFVIIFTCRESAS